MTDATLTFAVPLATLRRTTAPRDGRSRRISAVDPFWGELSALVDKHDACACVVGWPLTKAGTPSAMCVEVMGFVEEMERFGGEPGLPPVALYDERYSTLNAVQPMRDAGVSRRRVAKLKDQTAAVVILQDALDSLSVSEL